MIEEATTQKPLPFVFQRRAENVLHQAVTEVYRTSDASVFKCKLSDGSIKYVDLDKNIEAKRPTPLDATLQQWGEEDTDKLTGGNFASVITRDDLAEEDAPLETATKETADEVTDDEFAVMQRKTATKKKGAKNTNKKK